MKRTLAFELLSPVRQQIVLTLKRRGQCSMETLASELFLSSGAVRQNLAGLGAQGIVEYTAERAGPGRPRHLYQLTGDGHRLFPEIYHSVADALATAVEGLGSDVSEKVFDRVAESLFSTLMFRVEGRTPEQRLEELVAVLDENGYLPESRQVVPGTHELTVSNCPIFELARHHPATCEAELRCIQFAAGDATVKRTESLMQGDSRCTFIIRQP